MERQPRELQPNDISPWVVGYRLIRSLVINIHKYIFLVNALAHVILIILTFWLVARSVWMSQIVGISWFNSRSIGLSSGTGNVWSLCCGHWQSCGWCCRRCHIVITTAIAETDVVDSDVRQRTWPELCLNDKLERSLIPIGQDSPQPLLSLISFDYKWCDLWFDGCVVVSDISRKRTNLWAKHVVKETQSTGLAVHWGQHSCNESGLHSVVAGLGSQQKEFAPK